MSPRLSKPPPRPAQRIPSKSPAGPLSASKSAGPFHHAMSSYERMQIESVLQRGPTVPERDVGLYLMPDVPLAWRTFELAVIPSLEKNGIDARGAACVFDSSSNLTQVAAWLRRSEIILADLTFSNPDLLYVLGLAHGLGRCPLLLTQRPLDLPFNLGALRWLEYAPVREGLMELRVHLIRAIRVFLAAVRAGTD